MFYYRSWKPPPPRKPTERLASIIDGLRKAIAAAGPPRLIPIPLLVLIWNPVGRIAARVEAGKPPIRHSHPRTAPSQPVARKSAQRAPSGFGWLRHAVFGTRAFAGHLEILLNEPDMVALMEASPGIDRALRPLCRMLGIRRPPLPRRASSKPREPRRKPPAPPPAPKRPRQGWERPVRGLGSPVVIRAPLRPP